MVRDVFNEMLAELRGIRQGLGVLDDEDTLTNNIRPMNPESWVIVETADLPDDRLNDQKAVEIEPGEQARLIDYRPPGRGAAWLLALGAIDADDVEYAIRVDDSVVSGGWMNSPHGLLNDPFSLVESYGSAIPAERRIEYLARVDPDGSPAELVARLHVEVP